MNSDKKRILVFLPCFTFGGAEKQGVLLAQFLKSAGYDVEVWAFPSPVSGAPLTQLLTSCQIPCRELSSWPSLDWRYSQDRVWTRRLFHQHWSWPRQLRAYQTKLPGGEFDVILPFTFWPSLVATLMARRLVAGKVIWNHRGGHDDAGISYSAFVVQQILRRPPAFVANSTAGARFLEQTFSLSPDKVHVIHNAYVPDRDEHEERSLADEPVGGAIRVLHLANLFPEKDLETVIDAMGLLRSSGMDYRLDLAGGFLDNRHKKALEARVAGLGIDDRVVFHGSIGRGLVRRLLREADIGLLSSRSEGMPNSVMEYMYRGLPVVATDIPGVRELVGDDNIRWLFPVGDAATLRERLEDVGFGQDTPKRVGCRKPRADHQ